MAKRKRPRLPKIRWSRQSGGAGLWFASCGWLRVYASGIRKRDAEAQFWGLYNYMHKVWANTPDDKCWPEAHELKRRFARFDPKPERSRKGKR